MTSQTSSHFNNAMTFLLAKVSPTPLQPVNTPYDPIVLLLPGFVCIVLGNGSCPLQGAYLLPRVRKIVHVIFVKRLRITFDIIFVYLYVFIRTYKYIRNSVFLVVLHVTYLLSCPHFVKERLELTSRFFE